MNFEIVNFNELLGTILIWKGYVRAGNTERLRFMRGWHFLQVKKYCAHRGWIMHQLPHPALKPKVDSPPVAREHSIIADWPFAEDQHYALQN